MIIFYICVPSEARPKFIYCLNMSPKAMVALIIICIALLKVSKTSQKLEQVYSFIGRLMKYHGLSIKGNREFHVPSMVLLNVFIIRRVCMHAYKISNLLQTLSIGQLNQLYII